MPALVTALLLAATALFDPDPVGATSGPTQRIVAGARYDRHWLHEHILGAGYRRLWTVPIDVPVLDLQNEAGGLHPVARFGGRQSAVLALRGADGRDYTFRSVDKEPSAVLHPDLRDSFVRELFQDQMAAQHPASALVADRISTAAGVMSQQERLAVMPDDPALGEYRDEFAGMLGTFYEYPRPASARNPGFHGATEIIDREDLHQRLAADPGEQVDTHAFLRARLVDLLLGDFDRHGKQWRWARIPGRSGWQPIPEDRDMAFVRYEGIVPWIGAIYIRILQSYGPSYPAIDRLTRHGWEQDRWLLTGLEWREWERIAHEIQGRITDAVIADAVASLPREYQERDGARLAEALRGRRDWLAEAARAFYLHLAKRVDVHATDAGEDVVVERAGDIMLVDVRRRGDGAKRRPPHFRRHFDSTETDEVRLYLHGGDDHVVVRGGREPILLRVISGGSGTLDDRNGGGTRLYDSGGAFAVETGRRTTVDRRAYAAPAPKAPVYVDGEATPPRDWGYEWYPLPSGGYEPDVGLFLGGSTTITTYGFRKHPWSAQHTLSGGWAFGADEPRVAYRGQFRPENADWLTQLDLSYSGIETLGFFGFGNETEAGGSNRFYRVRHDRIFFSPGVEVPFLDDRWRIKVGPWVDGSRTRAGERLIDAIDPYGAGTFYTAGATTRLQFDTRDSAAGDDDLVLGLHDDGPDAGFPRRGVFAEVRSTLSPEILDVVSTWGSLRTTLAGYVSFGAQDRLTVAARVGGEAVFGKYPYRNAAYLGGGGTMTGSGTIRGYRQQRFAGDEMVFGNVDLRLFVARLKLVVPGDFGVLGFTDVGRVFLDGEDSRQWHPSGGGGIWFAPFTRANAISVTVAGSPEDALVYVRSGLHF